ncbi:MAG TPA: hypothetical protein DEQ02_10005 [Ruminococcaceae bacterium]|nr:hypothetical protein [Oscillospiraceae bacterium]
MNEVKKEYDKSLKCRGRPAESSRVRLRPVFREEPDIEKLGRAIMAMALRKAGVKENNKIEEEYEEDV